MCTAITLRNNNDYLFGRNLDVDFSFNEKVVITPKNYLINLRNGESFRLKYALIGMASIIDDTPLYYEASNTKGLSIAGLNFPNLACYNDPVEGKVNLILFEFIYYILGKYESVKEVRKVLKDINLTNIPFNKNIPNSPLHYMISDSMETIVFEQTKDGCKIYDNPYDIMTNNPEFSYHLWNILNYRNLNNKNGDNLFSNKVNLDTYCVGMGTIGLPGDTSSASRFVRGAFNLKNLPDEDKLINNITNFFHVLDSVSMVKGSTITNNNKLDITLYSCCCDCKNMVYYYKLYDNNRINAVKLTSKLENKDTFTCFDLIRNQDINYQN